VSDTPAMSDNNVPIVFTGPAAQEIELVAVMFGHIGQRCIQIMGRCCHVAYQSALNQPEVQ